MTTTSPGCARSIARAIARLRSNDLDAVGVGRPGHDAGDAQHAAVADRRAGRDDEVIAEPSRRAPAGALLVLVARRERTEHRPDLGVRALADAAAHGLEQLLDAVGRVGVVDDDVERLALVHDLPAAGRRSGLAQRGDRPLGRQPDGLAQRERGRRVVGVVGAGQARRALDLPARPAQPHRRLADLPARVEDFVGGRVVAVAQHVASGAAHLRRQLAAERIVDVDDRGAGGRLAGDEHRSLRRAVGVDRAVPVEVLGREVREHRDVGPERRRRLKLKARHLAHDPARRCRG